MESFNQYLDTVISFRKELHRHPEVSGKEVATANRIVSFLKQFPPDEMITAIGGTGIIAAYNGEKPGKTVLFRCELDALPIEEINNFEHRSVHKAVSHKCGHDGHMAILCGLAIKLHLKRPDTGAVFLLFQPSEEDGSGAQKVLSDTKFKSINPDYVFALHNLPAYPKNQIVVKNNTFTCAVNSIIIKLKGITAHAAEPEKGINPAQAIAAILSAYNKYSQPDSKKPKYCIITPVHIRMGKKAYGVSAGAGEIHFTVRSDSSVEMKNIAGYLEEKARSIADEYKLGISIKWVQTFEANENNSTAVDLVRVAANSNCLALLEKKTPFSWGEDFGLFTQKYKGAMFGIGIGKEKPALHNPDYDFEDEILQTGISIFHHISKQITDADKFNYRT
ncbi:amidohydrolase [Flavobacterium sp. ST-87]|uniref:Amidohydrolase n=1 Tax=Flavobacterium plantiphilum TaxID=3163297 RepID=A0ABW8XRA3_9FLAO